MRGWERLLSADLARRAIRIPGIATGVFTGPDALQACEEIEAANYAILGADLWRREGEHYRAAGEGWLVERAANELWPAFKARSIADARSAIARLQEQGDAAPAFEIVCTSELESVKHMFGHP